jgi:anti-sigma regulatory factor (Ser/Thr protein kinase)
MCSCTYEKIHDRIVQQERANIHDLRNLFGIVACAARLLDETSDLRERANFVFALKNTALRGGVICDSLISKTSNLLTVPSQVNVEFDEVIVSAIPIIQPMITRQISLRTDLAAACVASPLSAEDTETILIELVGNAVRHGEGASKIVVRSRCAAGKTWLLIADNGRARLERRRPPAHGYGVLRVERLVRSAQGELRLRRAKGGGMVVGICFPSHKTVTRGLPPSHLPINKEKHRENRQPIAA